MQLYKKAKNGIDQQTLPKIYNKNIIKVLTDNELQCILFNVKVKSVIQLKPLAGRVPVKRKRFAGFIKCLVKWLPERTGSLFLWHKRTIPLPNGTILPILYAMKMIS
ncbi:MAG: hypothetical protein IKS96_02230, partial [Fibrobacter sp.]|nr:hypothetical protein [Fibrobacter sp.]